MKSEIVWVGWICHAVPAQRLNEIRDFVAQVHADGFTHVLLLGMGGSSLAPEVLSLVFSPSLKGELLFSTLDSTDPAQILAADKAFPPEKTLYIVSSKSGGTAEINAMFNYFWERTGHDGRHFAAITDHGTNPGYIGKCARLPKNLPCRSNCWRALFSTDPLWAGTRSLDGN